MSSVALSDEIEILPVAKEIAPSYTDETITEAENFIDSIFNDMQKLNFKRELINNIETSIKSSLNVHLGKENTLLTEKMVIQELIKKENETYKLLVNNLERELEFMRRKISHKNRVIESLIGKVVENHPKRNKSEENHVFYVTICYASQFFLHQIP